MQPSSKFIDLHWMCNNIEVDPNTKLNLAKFYKKDEKGWVDKDEPNPSCVTEPSNLLQFETTGPYAYNMYTPLEDEPRCLALDVFFKEPVTVWKIRFQNYYVADVSVLAKAVGHRDWQTLVERKQLMESAHYESGSRLYFEIQPSSTAWTEVTEIRLILRQPSPCWKKFYIENISVYREKPECEKSCSYLTKLIKNTEEAMRMERLSEKQSTSIRSNSNIPFYIGTCGYEIEKFPTF